MKGTEVLRALAKKYYGLYLPVEKGMSQSPWYRQYVLAGKPENTEELPGFTGSEQDEIFPFSTPAGEVEVIYLERREDFELFLQKLAYRCEPEPIRPDVGAMMISGVINWEKIESHKRKYLEKGNLDWKEEFRRFTSRPENFKDRVLILSGGPYSNYPAQKAGYTPEEWKQISIDIRMYHECTHYVCRNRWPEKKETVLDEVLADAVGLLGATGRYDRRLALEFLGVAEDGTYTGGRLGAYVSEDELPQKAAYALEISKKIENICKSEEKAGSDPFSITEAFYRTL